MKCEVVKMSLTALRDVSVDLQALFLLDSYYEGEEAKGRVWADMYVCSAMKSNKVKLNLLKAIWKLEEWSYDLGTSHRAQKR